MAKEKMTKAEIQKRHHEIMVELDQIEERASKENRAFTAEENAKYDALVREDNRLHLDIQGMLDERELAKFNEQKSKSAQLREIFLQCRQERKSFTEVLQDREAANATTILLSPDTGNTHANIEASGAIPLTIHEIIDTKVPGLELPDDLRLLTGVVGDEVWPYSTDDVEFSIAGEVEKIGEQSLNFDKLKASPERVTAALAISNRAIDNASFDLFGFCNYKLAKGWAIRKALLTYSHCVYSHSLKPIFSLVDVEEIVLDENIGRTSPRSAPRCGTKASRVSLSLSWIRRPRPICCSPSVCPTAPVSAQSSRMAASQIHIKNNHLHLFWLHILSLENILFQSPYHRTQLQIKNSHHDLIQMPTP